MRWTTKKDIFIHFDQGQLGDDVMPAEIEQFIDYLINHDYIKFEISGQYYRPSKKLKKLSDGMFFEMLEEATTPSNEEVKCEHCRYIFAKYYPPEGWHFDANGDGQPIYRCPKCSESFCSWENGEYSTQTIIG